MVGRLTWTVNVCILTSIVTRMRYNFWIDPEQREGLRIVKERDGVLESEQVRRAINLWLEHKGVTVKKEADRKRVGARKRP